MNDARTLEERSAFGKKARAAVKHPVYPKKGIKPPCRLAFEAMSPAQRSEHVRKGWTPERRAEQGRRSREAKKGVPLGSKLFTEAQIEEVKIKRGISRAKALKYLGYLARKENRRAH
jgi:hypothetical protein